MKYLSILLILFLILPSCVEQISFPVRRLGGQLVVDGSITNLDGSQVVKLSFTSNSARIPEPINDAQIRIFDDEGNSEAYIHDEKHPGTYILPSNTVKGEIGRTYYLEINLSDGRVFRSVPEKMPAHPAKLDSIYYDFSIQQEVSESAIISEDLYIDAFINVDLSEAGREDLFLRWDVEEVFLLSPTDFPDPFGSVPPPCYVYVYTSDDDLNLFDGSKNKPAFINSLQIASQKIDYGFREKHYFSVYQKSLSRESFEYWKKIDALLSNVGNIFDTPPAPIPGNIYNVNDKEDEALGYFEAASVSEIRFRTFRDDIPVDQILECKYEVYKSFSDYPDYCLNCLTPRNSTYARPDFF